MDGIKKRETYIGQFELVGAIIPFLSFPDSFFRGYPVQLWIDNAGAVGALVKGYSGKPDCAKLVNTFHFAVAHLGIESLYIDYVPTESNIADVPSRWHEMSLDERAEWEPYLGTPVSSVIPTLADHTGEWTTYTSIAASLWKR